MSKNYGKITGKQKAWIEIQVFCWYLMILKYQEGNMNIYDSFLCVNEIPNKGMKKAGRWNPKENSMKFEPKFGGMNIPNEACKL